MLKKAIAALALALTIGSGAHASNAGHMFKSSTPTTSIDPEMTGSTTRPAAAAAPTRRLKKPLPPAVVRPATSPAH